MATAYRLQHTKNNCTLSHKRDDYGFVSPSM